jgi:hypothetical protein
MWIKQESPSVPFPVDLYRKSTKPTQPEDLFRISSEADQDKDADKYTLSITLMHD